MKHLKKIKKDYQRKQLENPFFRRNKKGSCSRYLKIFLWLGAMLIIFLFWLLFSSSLFKLKNIEITGLSRINNSELEQIVYNQSAKKTWIFFNQDNLFLFDREEVITAINNKYNFASLEINKRLPNKLNIEVGERPYSFIFQQGSSLYYASNDAFIISESAVTEEDKQKYLILENKSAENLIKGNNKISISDVLLSFMMNLNSKLSLYPDLGIERFVIDQESNTIKVKFKDGPFVYFSTKNDVAEQVERLVLVKKEKISDTYSKTSYIDLRYGNKVFIN